MARFDMSGLDSVIEEMRRLGEDTGPTAERMIMAGAEEVRKAWDKSARKHEYYKGGGKYATGDMIKSIGYSRKPNKVGDVLNIDVYPQGTDRKGVRNAEKAFILHYGTSKIDPSRWVDDAEVEYKETVVPVMKEIWDEYIEKKG